MEIIVFDYVMETPEGAVHGSFFFALDSQTLPDPRCSSLRLAHGQFEDPSNLVFRLIIALI